MSKQLTLLSILFSVVVALASCRGGNNTSLSVEGGDTVALKYSSLLTIVEHDGYVVADIKNPWKPGKMLHRYYLVPRTSDIKPQTSDLTDGTVIEIPIQRAAVFTTVHCALLTELGTGAGQPYCGCGRLQVYQGALYPAADQGRPHCGLRQWLEPHRREDYGREARCYHAVTL